MKFLFTCLFLLTGIIVYGQKIEYQKSYADALALAGKTNKLVFVTLMPPRPPNAAQLPPIKAAPEGKELISLYNKEFVNYQALFSDPSVKDIVSKFHPSVFPFYIFLDSGGNPVYKSAANELMQDRFKNMATQALDRVASGNTYIHYEQLVNANMISKEQLKDYIILRQGLGMFDNAKLIDKYVDMLSVSDLSNYNDILFIFQAGPLATSKAYKLAYTNVQLVDSIFKTEPLDVRVAINNRMINNTRAEAIKQKNVSLAQSAASLTARSWGTNYLEANKASAREMLNYYRAVNDTTRYFLQAGNFYDTYYLNIATDSARRLQAEQMAKMRTAVQNNVANNNLGTLGGTVQFVQLSPAKSLEVANVLNNAAYEFYTMGTHNTVHLTKALIWSRRSIQLSPQAGFYDTMAHIMYRLDFYDEALLNQNKAIEMAAKEAGMASRIDTLKAELTKMKTHQL